MCAAAVRAQHKNAGETRSDRECSDGLKSRLAARFADSGAKRRSRSASFCAAEASVRVPLDSLRTCERKCRRLNARGRPSFNCLPLVTRPERAEKGERRVMRARARASLGCSWALFARFLLRFSVPPPIASDGQFVPASSACVSLAVRIRLRALPVSWQFFLFRNRGCAIK